MPDDLGIGPVANVSPTSLREVKPGAHPGFIIGATDRPHDARIVARTIGVRCEFKSRDREFSAPANMHELAVQRRFYEDNGGSLRPEGGWPPGLARHRNLTHAELLAEVERLRNTYVVVRQEGKVDYFAQFFGVEPTEQVRRIHTLMREQMAAWDKLLESALARLPADTKGMHPEQRKSMACDLITQNEVEKIINMADPGASSAELELPELELPKPAAIDSAPVQAVNMSMDPATEADAGANPAEKMVDDLVAAGIPQGKALELATHVDLLGGAGKMTDDQIIAVLGSKARLAAAKAVIAKG